VTTSRTTIPATIAALASLFTTALPAVATAGGIIVGSPGTDVPDQYVAVAYDLAVAGSGQAKPGLPGVTGTMFVNDAGNENQGESYEVHCTASSWTGDVDVAGQLAVVAGLFSTCAAALVGNRNLSGVLPAPSKAFITRHEWYMDAGADSTGTSVAVMFAVGVDVEWVVWDG
jgi:hypothetical protein